MSYEYDYCTPSVYGNRSYDSMTEARWAAYFDNAGMSFIPEPETFKIGKNRGDLYTPDFFLPEQDTYVEVKNGNITWDACSKLAVLVRKIGKTGLMLHGSPTSFVAYFFSPDSTKSSNPFGRIEPNHIENYADFKLYPTHYGALRTEEGLTFSGHIIENAKPTPRQVSSSPNQELRRIAKERKRQLRDNMTILPPMEDKE